MREMSARCWFINATNISLQMGKPILSNMIMVGALVQTNVVNLSKSDIEAMVRKTFPSKIAELNIKAATRGMQAVQNQ